MDGNVEAPREGLGYVSVHMTTVHVNPTKEVLGDLLGPVQSRSRVVTKVGDSFNQVTKKREGKDVLASWYYASTVQTSSP